MSTRSSILDWFRRRVGLSADSAGERRLSNLLGPISGGMVAGAWSGSYIEQVQHYRHWVYRSINTIQTLCTKEPPQVVAIRDHNERKANRGAKWLTKEQKRKSIGSSAQEEMEQLPPSHPLCRLLADPNEPDTGGDLLRELIMFLELTGNAYLWKVPHQNSPGTAELWVIPTHWVWPISEGRTGRLIDHYEIRPYGGSSSTRSTIFEPEELIHFQFKSPLSKIQGAGPLQAGAEIIDTYESVQLARFASLKNGANVGSVIQLDAGYDPTDEDVRRFEAKWFSRFQGELGFDRPMILPPGASLIKSPAANELALMQSADQMRDYVLAMFGLAKTVCGFTDAVNRATFEGALVQAYFLVANPLLAHIGEVLTENLARDYDPTYRIFWPDMTPYDRQAQLAEWGVGFANGAVTRNEYRTWMNLEPIEGGDEILAPVSMAPMGLGETGFPDLTGGFTDAD